MPCCPLCCFLAVNASASALDGLGGRYQLFRFVQSSNFYTSFCIRNFFCTQFMSPGPKLCYTLLYVVSKSALYTQFVKKVYYFECTTHTFGPGGYKLWSENPEMQGSDASSDGVPLLHPSGLWLPHLLPIPSLFRPRRAPLCCGRPGACFSHSGSCVRFVFSRLRFVASFACILCVSESVPRAFP